MHGSIRDQLENLLATGDTSADGKGVLAHLGECPKCAAEFQAMQANAAQLRALRAPEQLEVPAGFYAKVVQRIEERTRISAWAAFLYSPLSKRLAYGSLSAALILGMYVFAEESSDGHLGTPAVAAQQAQRTPAVFGNQDEQRDAVLVNFASYERLPQ